MFRASGQHDLLLLLEPQPDECIARCLTVSLNRDLWYFEELIAYNVVPHPVEQVNVVALGVFQRFCDESINALFDVETRCIIQLTDLIFRRLVGLVRVLKSCSCECDSSFCKQVCI